MKQTDPRIDAYIGKSADFAKPILKHFRKLVHEVCPDVEETMKWNFPHFDYLGSMMCSIASFKQHCAIGFWKASLMTDAGVLIGRAKSEEAMGHLGKITSLKDLPKDSALKKYIKEGMKLNELGITLAPRKKEISQDELKTPDYFKKALSKNKKAAMHYERFSAAQKKEYLRWLAEAKTEATREKRLQTTIEWLSEGKVRNWKYIPVKK